MEPVLRDWWIERCLASGSAAAKLRAVERLAGRTDLAALRLLRQAARDPDPEIRCLALNTAAQIPNAETLDILIGALRDADDRVAETAILALRQKGAAPAIPALFSLLTHRSRRVRFRAAQTLEVLGWRAAGPEEMAAWEVACGHYDRAALLGGPALPGLARCLREGEYVERLAVVRALAQCPAAGATPLLIDALRDPEAAVRAAAAEALGLRPTDASVTALIRALKDPAALVRAAAATALGQTRNPAALDPLIAILADPQWEVRVAALEALGRLGDPRAFDPVAARLEDTDHEVRQQAAETLGIVGDERVVEKLVLTLMDPHGGVRQAAARALHRIDPGWQRSPRVQALLPTIQSALQHQDPAVQLAAAGLVRQISGLSPAELARRGSAALPAQHQQAAAATLEELASDPDPEVRLTAVEELARLRLPRSRAVLLACCSDPHPTIAAKAQAVLRLCDEV